MTGACSMKYGTKPNRRAALNQESLEDQDSCYITNRGEHVPYNNNNVEQC